MADIPDHADTLIIHPREHHDGPGMPDHLLGDCAPARQREAIEAFATAAGYHVVDSYYDAAVSGADHVTERPGFSAMLERLMSNGVRTILVETASRFARDLIVQETAHEMLKARGIDLIAVDSPDSFVADTPTALLVANLTQGRVGALEYQPRWPRLGDRYANRFVAGRPVTCVSDLALSWSSGGGQEGAPTKPVGAWLAELATLHPRRVRRVWTIDHFEVWEADLPLAEILAGEAVPSTSR